MVGVEGDWTEELQRCTGILWGDECIRYVGLGDGFMGVVDTRQNHHIIHFNYAQFIVCHTSAKLFLQKQFMCLDLGEFRFLGPGGTAVFISLKAWTELSCLLPWGSDRCGFLCVQVVGQVSMRTRLQGMVVSLEAASGRRWLVTRNAVPACMSAGSMGAD